MTDRAQLPERPDFTAEEVAALDDLAGFIVRRGLTTPAILFLESVRPLNRLGSVAMTFLQPIAGAFFESPRYGRLRDALERRGAIDLLLERIEARDAALLAARREKQR